MKYFVLLVTSCLTSTNFLRVSLDSGFDNALLVSGLLSERSPDLVCLRDVALNKLIFFIIIKHRMLIPLYMFSYILMTNYKCLIFITGYLYEFNVLNGGLVIKKNVIKNGYYEICTRISIFLSAYYKEIDEQSILIRLQTHLT